jgi:hypothetical protein
MDLSNELLGGRYHNGEIEEDDEGKGLREGPLYSRAEGQTQGRSRGGTNISFLAFLLL